MRHTVTARRQCLRRALRPHHFRDVRHRYLGRTIRRVAGAVTWESKLGWSDVIAIYAAVVATAVLLWDFWKWKSEGPCLRLDVRSGVWHEGVAMGYPGGYYLDISITNTGDRPRPSRSCRQRLALGTDASFTTGTCGMAFQSCSTPARSKDCAFSKPSGTSNCHATRGSTSG
jgi:hypothetical protein